MTKQKWLSVTVLLVAWAFALLIAAHPVALAKPSARTLSALETRLPETQLPKDCSLDRAISELLLGLRSLGFKGEPYVGFERDGSASPARPSIQSVPAGALREQLDAITKDAGYVWQANRDWLNSIPKDKASDPKYAFNLRILGKVVVSRAPLSVTPIKPWLELHRISVARDGHKLEIRPAGAPEKSGYSPSRIDDPFAMRNPTLREYFNAHEALYGNNRWSAGVTTTGPAISILESSWDTEKFAREWEQNSLTSNR